MANSTLLVLMRRPRCNYAFNVDILKFWPGVRRQIQRVLLEIFPHVFRLRA